MRAKDWNKLFEEERMASLDSQPETSGAAGEIWRTIPGKSYNLQISTEGNIRFSTIKAIAKGDKGICANDQYTYEERLKFRDLAFPLLKEKL